MIRLPSEVVSRLRPVFEGRRVCVTGGAGFIGGHLVDALESLGALITVVDDLSASDADHIADLIDFDPQRVRFVHGSILEDRAVAQAVAGTSVVFHLAAIGSVPRSVEDPERSWAVNATGTLRVLRAAAEAGVGRFVHSSSSSVYGDAGELPNRESQAPAPTSPYGASKLAAEGLVRAWARSYGLHGISLRYFNVFGPRQPAGSAYAAVVPAFASRLLAGERPVIYGDGEQSRDFTYVANVVLANLLSGAARGLAEGEAVNIGGGGAIRVRELAAQMATAFGAADEPEFAGVRTGDILHSRADVARAQAVIGYEPLVSLEEGLRETAAWWRKVGASGAEPSGARRERGEGR